VPRKESERFPDSDYRLCNQMADFDSVAHSDGIRSQSLCRLPVDHVLCMLLRNYAFSFYLHFSVLAVTSKKIWEV
jgi:hypothetical protein